MKVNILTEGGGNIGLGHVSRCLSLYEEIRKREIIVDFIINGEVNDIRFLKDVSFTNRDWLNNEFINENISKNDYVIIDSYNAEKQIYDTISKLSKNVIFIDDIGRLNYPKGTIVNPSLNSSHIDYSHSHHRKLLSGPEYIIIRSPFVNNMHRENSFNGIKKVLITMGATDIRELIPLFINTICINELNIEFDIVTSSSNLKVHYEKLCQCNNVSIHWNVNATQMRQLMIDSDLTITAAGQTIYELLATETPFIPIQLIDNQINNINSLLIYNPNQIVLMHNDTELIEKVFQGLTLYNEKSYRRKQIDAYKNLIDGCGAERIINNLLGLL